MDETLDPATKYLSEIEACFAKGSAASRASDTEQAALMFARAADLAQREHDLPNLSKAYFLQAQSIAFIQGDFQHCIVLLNECIRLNEQLGIENLNAVILRMVVYQLMGDKDQVMQILNSFIPRLGESQYLASAYLLTYATLAIDSGEADKAWQYLEMSLKAATTVHYPDLNYMLYIQMSRYYRMKMQPAVACSWIESNIKAARGLPPFHVAVALIEQAEARRQNQELAAAEEDLQTAIAVLEKKGAKYELARALFIRALWHLQDQKPEAAETWTRAAQAITRGGYGFILQKEQERAFSMIAAHLKSKHAAARAAAEDAMRALAQVPAPALRIVTMGHFSVTRGAVAIEDQAWSKRKAGELFRFLLLQPQRKAHKEQIYEELWGDKPNGSLAESLNQSTSALRHVLEPELPDKFPSRYLRVEGEMVTLTLPQGSTIDYERFEAAEAAARSQPSSGRWKEAVSFYTGDLFPLDRYKEWSAEKRENLRERYGKALVEAARFYYADGYYSLAIESCRQALKIDAWSEDAVYLKMRSYEAMGNIPQAIRVYRNLKKALANDLQINPRKDLQKLAEQLAKR